MFKTVLEGANANRSHSTLYEIEKHKQTNQNPETQICVLPCALSLHVYFPVIGPLRTNLRVFHSQRVDTGFTFREVLEGWDHETLK